MEKKVIRRDGLRYFLLGEDEAGKWKWLEEWNWQWNWYWGFGTIVEFTNHKRPDAAADIALGISWKVYFKYHPNHPMGPLKETTLTENESWQLAELLKTYYILENVAADWHGCIYGNHEAAAVTPGTELTIKNKELAGTINHRMLPKLFDMIEEILTPAEDKDEDGTTEIIKGRTGECPKCGEMLEYTSEFKVYEDEGGYGVKCEYCGFEGKEHNILKFKGYKVRKKGDKI